MAPASEIHVSTMFLLLIIVSSKVQHWAVLKCHNSDTEFHENRSNGSNVETGEVGTQTDIAYIALWSQVPAATLITYFVLAAPLITKCVGL
jgi:hypothetical protein